VKWFKHFSGASHDEFLEEIIDSFGLEGYARWWLILEAIASQMDGSKKCSVSYSWVKWQTILKGKRNKLETFLEHLENKSKIKLKQNGNKLEIECPNLLKMRDNYTKNLQVDNKETLDKTSKQEVEVEVEVDNIVISPKAKTKPKTKLPNDFELTQDRGIKAMKYWQKKNRRDLDPMLKDIFDQFKNHHIQHGSSMANWEAAWQTWYTNAVKFEKKPIQGMSKLEFEHERARKIYDITNTSEF